jgi:hypothetical protein
MYGEAPFSEPCRDPLQRLDWWKAQERDSNAGIISVSIIDLHIQLMAQPTGQILAIKLFSVSPSEMCDERTASRLSIFNSARRNGLSAENMVRMAQLQDHWTYGLEASTSAHTAALQLPKLGNTTQSLHLPAPRLQDLLNPAPLDSNSDEKSEPTFMFDDPYGANLLDEDNDSETDNEPIITRGFHVERLEIENVVDLANKKLLARYDDALQPKNATQPAKPARKETVPSKQWLEENWAAKAADF